MADLVVNLDMVQSTANTLNNLANEFNNASQIVGDAAIGDDTIDSALGNFTGNWKVHRESLVSSMQSVQKMASQSYQDYTTTDSKLASELQKDN
jgi:hypothetical protein